MTIQLKTEQIFKKLTVPCTKEELEKLEKSLLRHGCLDPIITWNGVILDGHKRYRICSLEGIEFEVTEMHFSTQEDAIIWICRRRTKNLPKSSPAYRYLVGKWYAAGIILNRRKEELTEENMFSGENDGRRRYSTSREIGREIGYNYVTIEKFKRLSIALDAIAEKDPALFNLMIIGEYKTTQDMIIKMASRRQRFLQEERKRFQRQSNPKQHMEKEVSLQQGLEAERGNPEEVSISVGIKEMPAFDPDMELRGLALTLPTWMNAMERARTKTDMQLASGFIKDHLKDIFFEVISICGYDSGNSHQHISRK